MTTPPEPLSEQEFEQLVYAALGHTGVSSERAVPILAAYREQAQALEEARTDCDVMMQAYQNLRSNSRGVVGLHLNGDEANWEWLENNEWLEVFTHPRPGTTLLDELTRLRAERDALKAELERERMRLAGCGVAAMRGPEEIHPDYESASRQDVLRLYAKEGQP